MQPEEIKRMIEAGIAGASAMVTGDGSHFDAVVVSEAFDGKSMLQEQRMVYAALGDKIHTGELHALSIKAFTPEEWERERQRATAG